MFIKQHLRLVVFFLLLINSLVYRSSIAATQTNSLTITASKTNLCNGGSTSYKAITKGAYNGNISYKWYFPGGSPSFSTLKNPSVSYSTSGSYPVKLVVTAKNITDSISYNSFITVKSPIAAMSATVALPVCVVSSQMLEPSVTGGFGSYKYSWNTGATTKAVSNLKQGTYSLVVTDANNCSTQTSVMLKAAGDLTVTVTTTSLSCSGGNNAIACVNASGGVGPYSYTWSTGETTQCISGLGPGTYSVSVIDGGANCHIPAVAVILPVSTLGLSLTTNSVVCFSQSNGSVSANPSGGSGGYTYVWSNLATSSTISGVPIGVYSVTVNDGGGCSAIATSTVNGPTQLNSTIWANTVACGAAVTTASVAVSGGVGSYTYNWSNGATGNPINNAPVGVVSVTVLDANSCSITKSVTVTSNSQITVNITTTSVSCNGGSTGNASVQASGGSGNYTYVWSNLSTGASITNILAGVYSVTVDDGSGCVIFASASVAEPIALSALISATNIGCTGSGTGAALATVSGGSGSYTYLWSTNATLQQVNNLTVGTYSVVVTDGNLCSISNTVSITQNSALTASVTSVNANCNQADGSALVIVSGGSGAYTYLWSNAQFNAQATSLVAGLYTVTVTEGVNCLVQATVNVSNNSGVSAQLVSTNSVSCYSGTNGSIEVVGTGGSIPYQYSWNTSSNNPQLSALSAGVYTCTVKDNQGCVDFISVTISEPPLLTTTINSTSVTCNGGSDGTADVFVLGGTPSYSYQWSNGFSLLQIAGLTTGTYSVIIADANGCTSTSTVLISEPPLLTVTISGNSMVCSGQQTSISATASGGSPTYMYSWNNSFTGQNLQLTVTGLTTLTVVAIDNNGCTAFSTSVIDNFSVTPVSFTANDTSGCPEHCVVFSIVNAFAQNVNWDFGDGNTSALNNPTHCYSASGAYAVSLTLIDANGCAATQTKNNYIQVVGKPTANFTATPLTTSILDPLVQFTDNSVGAATWLWSFGDGNHSTSTNQNTTFSYDQIGDYNVTLLVANSDGCMDSTTLTISITPDFLLYIPNTFTPNDDGRNDVFLPYGVGVSFEKYVLEIFDRWGNLIWETTQWGEGWDGRANGGADVSQQEVYVYKISAKDVLGYKHSFVGNVNLIK
ncbi:MAG: gliding motility-associated C-terminal domain-containing protein [Bacteroidetes bacterium]|nr:gliding motility-associated C-terminal domain-containing protein [Bacteroidota bacterium]